MPELPEVEVLRLSLKPHLEGRRFEGVQVSYPELREPIPGRAMRERLPGRRIEALRRRAKYLLIDVEGDRTLAVHLGMSGRLTLCPVDSEPEPHEHVAWRLEGGERLRLRDPRRFGLVLLLPTEKLESDRHFAHLGIEPLAAEFSGRALHELRHGCRGPVKTFLMDARRVVGVGNIYACEALFRAGIHPGRSVARIGQDRLERLAHAVRETLSDAIEQGGTTLNDFQNGDGEPGYFQVSLDVYGREGKPCPNCSRTIRRIVHANRSTFYCPNCQR